jgi:hypothetical protein
MKSAEQILKEKIDYHGETRAAIEFAMEECANQFKIKCMLCNAPLVVKTNKDVFCINEDCYYYDHPIK